MIVPIQGDMCIQKYRVLFKNGVNMKGTNKKERWIIVTNKKTYLFLVAILFLILLLIGDSIYIFVFDKKESMDFLQMLSYAVCCQLYVHIFLFVVKHTHIFIILNTQNRIMTKRI